MVKLFVGNLAETVDNTKLLQVFTPHCRVTECDVLKNYAFVHIEDERVVDDLIKRLEGYVLEGRAIHIERSTSRLRKQPGMSDKCFRCGATEHKTQNCPFNEDKSNVKSTIKIDLTNSNNKRPYSGTSDGPAAKQPSTHGYYAGQQVAAVPQQAVVDQEIARPVHADLQPLYEQYMESRQRYAYFRDRLLKEMQARSSGAAVPLQQMALPSTQLSGQPVSYLPQPTAAVTWAPQAVQNVASHPYAAQPTTALKAPYAMAATGGQPCAPYVTTMVQAQPGQVMMTAPGGQLTYAIPAGTQPSAPYATAQQQQPMPLMSAQTMTYQHTAQQLHVPASYAVPATGGAPNGMTSMSGTPGNYRWT